MVSAYQVNNVIRVYKGQLRQGKISSREDTPDSRIPDKINISSDTQKKAVIDRIASDAFERITANGPRGPIEKKAFKKLENEYGAHLSVTKKNSREILFKEIDKDGETIHSLSLQDSKFLSHKLKEITKETVDENMF